MPANGMDSPLFYQPPISIMIPVIERNFNMERIFVIDISFTHFVTSCDKALAILAEA